MMSRLVVIVTGLLCACAQPQPQPAYYPAPQQQPYDPYAANGTYQGDPNAGYGTAPQPAGARAITINGAPASQRDLATLDALEQQWGQRLPSGHYWYDATSGAAGYWGGPMIGTLPAGLALGGPLPPNASGGGDGSLTGVFINGRELHPQDVAQLQALVGEVPMGRWWVDGNGNFGAEGGGMMGNLYTIAQQQGGGASSSSSSNGSVYVRGGCVQVTGSDGSTMSTGC